jgi:hypothetical protein
MNKPLAILTLTALGCGTAAAWFHSQLKIERQRNEELQTRIASLEQPRPPNPFTRLPSEPSPVSAEIGAPAPAPSPVTAALRRDPEAPRPAAITPEKSTQMRQRFVSRQHELLRDPEYRQAMLTQQRFSLKQVHPDLARELNVSQEQADRLLELLAEQQLRNMEAPGSFPSDRTPNEAEMAQLQKDLRQRERANRAEIAALLGSNGTQQWQDYEDSMGARMRVRQLSSTLDNAGIPLRDDQRQSLRDTLAQLERQAQQERQTLMPPRNFATMTPADRLTWQEEQIERTAQSYARARDSVSHILTTEQLQTYRDLQEQELTMRRAGLRMQRAQIENAADPAASALIPGNYFFSSGTQVVVAE